MKVPRILIILLLGTASSLSAALTKTTTTISSALNPSTYGQAVTFTANVTSAQGAPPDGESVTFLQGSKAIGTGTLTDGVATFTISTLTTGGTDDIKTQYPGDANLAGSTSTAVAQVVNKATTTTTLASSLNPSNVGQSVTFTATVTPEFGGTLTGTVGFYNGNTKLGSNVSLSGGVATYTTTTLAAGTDSITAVYNGSSSFITSTSSAVSQTAIGSTATTTTISSSQNPSTYGQAVTFTAKVSTSAHGTPPNGESVTFLEGSKSLGTGTLTGGVATFTISTLTTGGTDNIKAQYPGDSNLAGSTSTALAQVVNMATTTTTLVSSLNPANVGQSVTFTASVTPEFGGTVTGTVAFYNGTTKLTTISVSGGVANYITANLAVGTESISAVYSGTSSFITSTSNSVSQTVGSGTLVNSTLTWDGVTRYYQVFQPTALPASPPLVLMLHGTHYTSTFDPDAVTSVNWGWQPVANQYGFIVVQPASTYNSATTQWNWNAYFMDAAFLPSESGTCTEPPATGCPDDAGFLRQLIVTLTTQYNVNPNQVYVAGFSSGAQMAERVGVEISDLVAAIAPTSGQLVGQQVPPPGLPQNALAPIAVQEWAGTADNNLWPCNYGTTQYSGVTFTLDTVDDTYNYWVQQNSCTVQQTTQTLCLNDAPNYANDAPTPGMPGLTGNIATSCANNTEVQFIWEPGIGHSFQSKNNTARWLFFAANPKPPAP